MNCLSRSFAIRKALTKKELQIVLLVAEGLMNRHIVGRLSISERTVSTHMQRIFAKLHVDSRAAMGCRYSQLV
jgi:DNA-binding NarL/FixJ family response regulator